MESKTNYLQICLAKKLTGEILGEILSSFLKKFCLARKLPSSRKKGCKK